MAAKWGDVQQQNRICEESSQRSRRFWWGFFHCSKRSLLKYVSVACNVEYITALHELARVPRPEDNEKSAEENAQLSSQFPHTFCSLSSFLLQLRLLAPIDRQMLHLVVFQRRSHAVYWLSRRHLRSRDRLTGSLGSAKVPPWRRSCVH